MRSRVQKKRCSDCGKPKSLSEFHKNRSRSDGRQGWCKDCHNERARKWRVRNPGHYQTRKKRDPLYFRRMKLKNLYGILLEDYERMMDAQEGVCAICGRPETRKLNQQPAPLVVDHDHKTKAVRGLLCHSCNIALGFIERPGWLEAAIRYLASQRKA